MFSYNLIISPKKNIQQLIQKTLDALKVNNGTTYNNRSRRQHSVLALFNVVLVFMVRVCACICEQNWQIDFAILANVKLITLHNINLIG